MLKNKLDMNGFREKQLKFYAEDNASEFMSKIFIAYPKLENIGGIDFMKVVKGTLKVVTIDPGKNGYDYKCIKLGTNNGKLYIRPIQRNLDLEDTLVTYILKNHNTVIPRI